MANGDVTHIKELGRFPFPGGGRSLGGVAKNNKIMVWGEIEGVHEDTYGINLTTSGGVSALGLKKLDYIAFENKSSGASGTPVYSADEACFTAHLGWDSEEIYCLLDADTRPTAGHVVVLSYFAIGDSNEAPALV